jgi:hypothetical protein
MLEEEVFEGRIAQRLFIGGQRAFLRAYRVPVGQQWRVQDKKARMGRLRSRQKRSNPTLNAAWVTDRTPLPLSLRAFPSMRKSNETSSNET